MDENFRSDILDYFKKNNIFVRNIEQEGEIKSIVFHINKEDNNKIEKIQKEMEQKFDVAVVLSSLYGMNTVIVESNSLEE